MDQIRPIRILQGNLNHSSGAQNVFAQSLLEWSIDIAVMAEPYFVPSSPPNPYWASDSLGLVVVVSSSQGKAAPPTILERGAGFVSALWEGMVYIGVYFSPSKTISEFESFLDQLTIAVRRASQHPLIVLGDFNAKSTAWGSRCTDMRGRAVEEWMALAGLALLNSGTELTCVRQRGGGSIVDLTFATPAVAIRIPNWRVMVEEETLSDHRYIRFDIFPPSTTLALSNHQHRSDAVRVRVFPRWSLSRMNKELAEEAAIIESCFTGSTSNSRGVDDKADRLRAALSRICDSAMPRVTRRSPRKQVYWWTTEIADLRKVCVSSHRALTRYHRRRVQDATEEACLHEAHCEAKKALRAKISRAKAAAHKEMLESLDRDPWGRPYRAIRAKFAKLLLLFIYYYFSPGGGLSGSPIPRLNSRDPVPRAD
jgi:hypothetical protein